MQEDQPVTGTVELHEIHLILAKAAQRTAYDVSDAQVGFRMNADLKLLCETVCLNSGSSLSEFLRECCRELARGYKLEAVGQQ